MASLPPELEKSIFELTAYSEPKFVPTLKLVASGCRVNEWQVDSANPFTGLEVLLGSTNTCTAFSCCGEERRTITKCGRTTPATFFTRLKSIPPSVLRHSVCHLYLELMPIDLCRYLLSTCTAVEDLWIDQADSSLLDLVAALPLRRLHCHPVQLFSTQEQLDFGHRVFSNLTHLELFVVLPELNPSPWTGLTTIPHLTHLSFSDVVLLPLVASLLQDSKFLRVLVFIFDPDWMEADDARVVSSFAPQNLRFVQMECSAFGKDWRSGALGRGVYWDRAEAFVAKRMSKEIDPALYVLKGDERVLIVD